MKHEGKSVLVTGGANGIGRGIVERFLQEGASLTILDIADDAAEAAIQALGPDRAMYVHADVTDEAQVTNAVSQAVARWGKLDVAVNNAGTILAAPTIETTVDEFRRLMDLNVTGVFIGSKLAARQMLDQGHGGSIINASSGAGRGGAPLFAAYCASKAAIIRLSQSLALEVAAQGIRVNCYAPGHTDTGFWDKIAEGFNRWEGLSRDEVVAASVAEVPLGRFCTPAEVGAAVSWLASDDATFIVGQTIGVNGGQQPWD